MSRHIFRIALILLLFSSCSEYNTENEEGFLNIGKLVEALAGSDNYISELRIYNESESNDLSHIHIYCIDPVQKGWITIKHDVGDGTTERDTSRLSKVRELQKEIDFSDLHTYSEMIKMSVPEGYKYKYTEKIELKNKADGQDYIYYIEVEPEDEKNRVKNKLVRKKERTAYAYQRKGRRAYVKVPRRKSYYTMKFRIENTNVTAF